MPSPPPTTPITLPPPITPFPAAELSTTTGTDSQRLVSAAIVVVLAVAAARHRHRVA